MSMENAPLTIRDMIEPAIMAAGGWVNTHAHADRAYTLSPDVLELRRTCTLQQKWDALDRLKRESTEEIFYRRFCTFFENQIKQGVTALATFVGVVGPVWGMPHVDAIVTTVNAVGVLIGALIGYSAATAKEA